MFSGIEMSQQNGMNSFKIVTASQVCTIIKNKNIKGGLLKCDANIYCNKQCINPVNIPLSRAECDDSLPFSGASSIRLCYILFPAILLYQLFFHPPSLHLAIYFSVYLSVLLFPDSYIIRFWEFYFLPVSVHVQIYVAFLSLMVGFLTIA
jgi:hypothetical protein